MSIRSRGASDRWWCSGVAGLLVAGRRDRLRALGRRARSTRPGRPARRGRRSRSHDGSTTDDIGSRARRRAHRRPATACGSPYWSRRQAASGPFQAGVYDLSRTDSLGDVVAVLQAGPRAPGAASIHHPGGARPSPRSPPDWPIPRSGSTLDAAELQRPADSPADPLALPTCRRSLDGGDAVPRHLRVARRSPTSARAVDRMRHAARRQRRQTLNVEARAAELGVQPLRGAHHRLAHRGGGQDRRRDRAKIARVIYNRLERRRHDRSASTPPRVRGRQDRRRAAHPRGPRRRQTRRTTPASSPGCRPRRSPAPGRASIEAAAQPRARRPVDLLRAHRRGHVEGTTPSPTPQREFLAAKRPSAVQNGLLRLAAGTLTGRHHAGRGHR